MMLVGVEHKGVNLPALLSPDFYTDFIPLATWVPFFDDGGCSATEPNKSCLTTFSKVTAIIFIVPLSAFNQVLDESEYSFVLETSSAHRYRRHLREQTSES